MGSLGKYIAFTRTIANAERFVALARPLTGPDISNIIDLKGWKVWKERGRK